MVFLPILMRKRRQKVNKPIDLAIVVSRLVVSRASNTLLLVLLLVVLVEVPVKLLDVERPALLQEVAWFC